MIFDSWMREREFDEKISDQSYVFLRFFFINIYKKKLFYFVKHNLKESVEVYRGRNLHPLPLPTDRDPRARVASQTVTDRQRITSRTVTDPITIVTFYINSKIDILIPQGLR
jgi:hypothetical protein